MRKVFTFLLAVLLTASVFAQSPDKMSYQAVIRDASDNLIADTQIGMQISILQGSASGTAVYVETQTPSTNANGLVSLEIGTGTTSDDFSSIDWANGPYFIKTETAVEAPLTTYTITGTSQLSSVPYALQAKTAETVRGGITETDPIYGASQAANITAAHITNLGNISGTNTGDQNISGIATNKQAIQDTASQIRADIAKITETDPIYGASQAANITATHITSLGNISGTNTGDQNISGILINKQAIQDTASQIRADIPTVTTYSVGDFAQGGIVFWVDETGQHGLVAAKEDQSTGVRWYAGTDGSTQAKGDGPFAGEANTSIIIAAQVAIGDDGSTYAARICNELQITVGGKTYRDWYLPSKEELNLMYQNKTLIDATAGANGGSSFADAYYWSSTEDKINNAIAWLQYFNDGNQISYFKGSTYRVRAVGFLTIYQFKICDATTNSRFYTSVIDFFC